MQGGPPSYATLANTLIVLVCAYKNHTYHLFLASSTSFRSSHRFLDHAHGVLLVYDITRRDTFERIDSIWLPSVASASVVMLIGTKCDQQDRRAVTIEEAKAYAG